jgi:class 3 adenylate cyclase
MDRNVSEAELTYTKRASNPWGTRRLRRVECGRGAAGRSTPTPLAPRDALYGTERKFVSVLSADVKGSMALSRSIELEDWWTVMGELFEIMCEGVALFHGWIGGLAGDGVIAVFDGDRSTPHEHARDACDAALWLRDAVRRHADELRRRRDIDLSVRIGVNSGEVLTGMIGPRRGRYFTANGYAMALAKRVEALAIPGSVFVSDHTAHLLGDKNHLRDVGTFEVKGAASGVHVFELLERSQ